MRNFLLGQIKVKEVRIGTERMPKKPPRPVFINRGGIIIIDYPGLKQPESRSVSVIEIILERKE